MSIEFNKESGHEDANSVKKVRKQELFVQQRKNILKIFSHKTRTEGLRAVSMANIAKDLAISTKTLYKHFPTKAILVQTVVNEKSEEINKERSRRIMNGVNAHRRIEASTLEWFDQNNELGEKFLHELGRDFPEIFSLYEQHVESFLARSAKVLKPEIRKGLNKDYALSVLWKAINQIPSLEECEQLGIKRKQALSQTIDIWARGCLKMYQ